MLFSELGGIDTPQSGINEDIEHDALSRTSRPSFLELDNFVFIPDRKALGLRLRRGLTDGGIGCYVLGINRPFVKPAHGGEEKPGGEWPAAIDALPDRCACDARQGLVAGSCQNAAHDIFA